MNDLIGGRYRIERRLGVGGMGAVYEATDTTTEQVVAVKVVTADVAKNAQLLSRFEREVNAARGLNTPHVVRFLDAGRDSYSSLPYLVMEVLDGEDLQRFLKENGPVRPDLALRIVAQACLGLEAAHAQHIVHRDIKPANLFLTLNKNGTRTVKILDFGIAKLRPDGSQQDQSPEMRNLTQTGSMLGSPLYMSPEQARGHKHIDERADIWSLGIVLYQTLTGRTPHQDNDALGDLIIAICTEPAEPVTTLAPWVPQAVANIVDKALSLDPNGRFQSAAALREAIMRLLPDGMEIYEEQLVPLPANERVSAAAEKGTERGVLTMSQERTSFWTKPGTRDNAAVTPFSPFANGSETPSAMQIGLQTSAPSSASTQNPSFSQSQAPKKRTGITIGLIVGLLAVIGGAAFFTLAGSRGTDKDGTSASAHNAHNAHNAETRPAALPPTVAPATASVANTPVVDTSGPLSPTTPPSQKPWNKTAGTPSQKRPNATPSATTPRPTNNGEIFTKR